jgi:pantothenate kinase-related protein Tda10
MDEIDRFVMRAVQKIVQQAQRLQSEESKPLLIAIDGRSGSGKSTVASGVAEELGAPRASYVAWIPRCCRCQNATSRFYQT